MPSPRALSLPHGPGGDAHRAPPEDRFYEGRVHRLPPERLALAAGPFGEELAVLSWADRLAAQGPRLRPERVERHEALCAEFLNRSRALGPHPDSDYRGLAWRLSRERPAQQADVGYAASGLRLLVARGMDEQTALAEAPRLL